MIQIDDRKIIRSLVRIDVPDEINNGIAGISACTPDYIFLAANQQMADFYGMQAVDLLGRSVFDFNPRFRTSIFYAGAQETITTGRSTARVGFAQSTKQWMMVRTFIASGYPVMSAQVLEDDPRIIVDIDRDPITSLRNTIALHEDIQNMTEDGVKFGLVLLRAKQLSHPTTQLDTRIVNLCMMEFAARLVDCTASNNQVYRIEDDLFAMIVPNAAFGKGALMLEIHRALSAAGQPYFIGRDRFDFGMSMGHLLVGNTNHTSSELLGMVGQNMRSSLH